MPLRDGAGVGLAEHNPASQEAFLDAATARLMALEDGDADDDIDEAPRPKKRKPKPVVEEEPEVDEVEDEAEEADESDEDMDEQDAGDDAEYEDDDEDAPKISVRMDGKKATLEDVLPHLTATITVDGEDVEVDGSELLKGYQRGADYTRKTTEVKQMREEILPYQQMVSFAKHDPQFLNYVQSYFQNGPYPELASNPDLKVTDAQLSGLLDRNSDTYDPERAQSVLKARADWSSKSQERQKVSQAAQQDMMASYNQWAGEQIERAREMINAMGEPPGKDGKDEYTRKGPQVLAFLKNMGFNDDEISGRAVVNATDARLAAVAYMAAEFNRISQESEAPRVTLGKKRKRIAPPRSQSSGSGTRSASSRKRVRDTSARAIKTQKSDDWVSAIANRIKL